MYSSNIDRFYLLNEFPFPVEQRNMTCANISQQWGYSIIEPLEGARLAAMTGFIDAGSTT